MTTLSVRKHTISSGLGPRQGGAVRLRQDRLRTPSEVSLAEADGFADRLAEAVSWCSRSDQWPPQSHHHLGAAENRCRYAEFRSIALRRRLAEPYVDEHGEWNAMCVKASASGDRPWDFTSTVERRALVEDLLMRRESKLRELGARVVDVARGAESGKLLAYFPSMTIWDGFSMVESSCYFDCFDTPPWDTWIWYIADVGERLGRKDNDCLISWVPAERIEAIDNAIDCNPGCCLAWASTLETPYLATLLR